MNRIKYSALLLLFSAAVLTGAGACVKTASIAAKHPDLPDPNKAPLCSDCHSDRRSALNHTADFSTRHKFYAMQQKQSCTICHKESFCADCHANKEELKPSDKYKDSPERALPHRGDYLTQHKIDGRINPASCFPCHGRQNNERCKVCHR
jgi:hypothetical protein